ncbi:hypothetical protein CsSME_00034407 [Camellia sinensis var. sinensis]
MIKQVSGNFVLPDEGIDSVIAKLRGYLYEKRYVIVFDDVAAFCKETSVDQVHELGALREEQAWELFCKKAFQLDFGDHCPLEVEKISHEIVRKCEGLPLAIVAIGGLLSTKNKTISEW